MEIIDVRPFFFIGDRQKGNPQIHDQNICQHIDCTSIGTFFFPGVGALPIGALCPDHKLAGTVDRKDIHEPGVPTLDDEYYEGEVPILTSSEHAHFCWDDEGPAALACNYIVWYRGKRIHARRI